MVLLTIDELNILEVVDSSATVRVPALECRVENCELTSVVSVDSVSTVKDLSVCNNYITSTCCVDTTDTVALVYIVITIDLDVLDSRTCLSLDKTCCVRDYIINTLNS